MWVLCGYEGVPAIPGLENGTGRRRARPLGIPGAVEGRDARGEAPRGGAPPFGTRLRGFRRVAGLTQEELASRAGLSPNAVGALERGARRRPQPHTVRSLSDALGLTVDERAHLLA